MADMLSLEVKAFKTINVGQDDEDDIPMAIHNVDVEDGTIYIYVKDVEEKDVSNSVS